MSKGKEILEYQKEQKQLKLDIEKIKKSIPIHLIGIIFLMFLIIFGIEEKVYPLFGGTMNFIVFGSVITLIICFFYFYVNKKRIKEKNKQSKNIGAKIYSLMKLEND